MEVEVIVEGDGTVVVRYNGFQGRACFNEAMKLYNMLSSMGVNVRVERVEEAATYSEGRERVKC